MEKNGTYCKCKQNKAARNIAPGLRLVRGVAGGLRCVDTLVDHLVDEVENLPVGQDRRDECHNGESMTRISKSIHDRPPPEAYNITSIVVENTNVPAEKALADGPKHRLSSVWH